MIKIICLLLFFGVSAFSQEIPAPLSYVSDFAGILDAQSKSEITSDIQAIESASGVEIAVVILQSLEGYPIEALSVEYFDKWKIGKKGADNGILIMVAIQDRKAWITVGYGLEGVLPDGLVGEIYRNEMVPRFRQGDYAGGIRATIYKLGRVAAGEKLVYPNRKRKDPNSIYLIFLFFTIMIILSIISRFSRRRRGIFFIPPIFFGGPRSGSWGSGSGGFGGFGGFGGGATGGGGAGGSW